MSRSSSAALQVASRQRASWRTARLRSESSSRCSSASRRRRARPPAYGASAASSAFKSSAPLERRQARLEHQAAVLVDTSISRLRSACWRASRESCSACLRPCGMRRAIDSTSMRRAVQRDHQQVLLRRGAGDAGERAHFGVAQLRSARHRCAQSSGKSTSACATRTFSRAAPRLSPQLKFSQCAHEAEPARSDHPSARRSNSRNEASASGHCAAFRCPASSVIMRFELLHRSSAAGRAS